LQRAGDTFSGTRTSITTVLSKGCFNLRAVIKSYCSGGFGWWESRATAAVSLTSRRPVSLCIEAVLNVFQHLPPRGTKANSEFPYSFVAVSAVQLVQSGI
jgi:hypothetical protein